MIVITGEEENRNGGDGVEEVNMDRVIKGIKEERWFSSIMVETVIG